MTTLVIVALTAALAYVLLRGGGPEDHDRLARDRSTLVRACVDMADLVDSDALRERLLDALAECDVGPVIVDPGEPFDSARHRAVGRVLIADAERHNLVAETARAGYIDRGRRLRWPDVLVYDATREAAP